MSHGQIANLIKNIVYLETLICTPRTGRGEGVSGGKKEELSSEWDNAALMRIIFHSLFEYLK